MQQLLAFEIFLKAVPGVLLLFLPVTSSRLTGLPRDELGLWPRLLGAVLIGVAIGVYLEWRGFNGVSIASCVAINFVGAVTIFASLILKRSAATWRGRAILSLVALVLCILLLGEIAFVA